MPIRCLALQIDLPGSAEQIEVVDVVTAQRRLQGGEYVIAWTSRIRLWLIRTSARQQQSEQIPMNLLALSTCTSTDFR